MKIKIINKKHFLKMTQKQKQTMSLKLILFLCKNTKILTGEEMIKILKNIYNLKCYKHIEFLNGEIYKILSNGTLKKVA